MGLYEGVEMNIFFKDDFEPTGWGWLLIVIFIFAMFFLALNGGSNGGDDFSSGGGIFDITPVGTVAFQYDGGEKFKVTPFSPIFPGEASTPTPEYN